MELISTGAYLLFEWLKTLLIFTVIDRLIIRRKIKEILRNHDTYISSLVVASFLIILRYQNLSFFTFLLWAVIVVVIYSIITTLFKILIGK